MTGNAVTAAVGLGSNLEDPVRQVETAIARLAAIQETRLLKQSSLYRSAPLGPADQPDFVNAVALLETRLAPDALFAALQHIERFMGRQRDGTRWGPRVIDIDFLLYGDRRINSGGLVVPHPRMHERNFVLLPLREIAPDIDIPGHGALADLLIDEGAPRIARIVQRG